MRKVGLLLSLLFTCFFIGCASVDKDKSYFYTVELSPDYKILNKEKSFGHLKSQPPDGHFRYWVYNKNGVMIYKGVYQNSLFCLPESGVVTNQASNLIIRIPAESKRIRFLTYDLQDITTITFK